MGPVCWLLIHGAIIAREFGIPWVNLSRNQVPITMRVQFTSILGFHMADKPA